MQVAVSDQGTLERALRRSAVYRFLSAALCPPGEGFAVAATAAIWRATLEAARAAGEETATAAETALAACAGLAPEALTDAYHETFGHQIGTDCPLYEAQYTAGEVFQQAHCLADIAAFYHAFGLDVGEDVRERPDHVSLELEFMSVLTYREAYARTHHGPAEVALLVDAQRAFLQDHLARWVPAFSRLVARKDAAPYRSLAALLAAWIVADAGALGVPAADDLDLTPSTAVSPPESDLSGCGVGRCPLEPSA